MECAETGFKRDKPALVYLVTNQRLRAAKIGICNLGTGRVEKHEGRGWRRYKTLEFIAGCDAETVEQEVIAEWRAQGWKPVRDGKGTYDGWTETVPLNDEITVEALWTGVLELRALLLP
ncbi:hypothetical protein ACIBLB_35690 [Streptosporangium canum]|uniref:hypothetical protein n=1 Tax=Streptosporangium canum TaxID=324952 RepID=UPI0037B92786